MKCGASQKLFASSWRLSSRSLSAASAKACPSVSTSLYFFSSSSSVNASSNTCGCSIHSGWSGIVSTLLDAFSTQLSPQVFDTVFVRCAGQKRQRQFQDDCIAVLTCSSVLAGVHEPEISVCVFFEPVAVPRQWSGRQFPLGAMPPFRLARVVVEKVVAFQFEKCLRDLELPQVRHRVGHMIEL